MTQMTFTPFAQAEKLSQIFDSETREQWQGTAHILAKLALTPNQRIADIGAGTGYFSALFANALPQGHVYALDTEPNMVAFMRERFTKARYSNVTVAQSGPINPCLPEHLDVIFMANVYRFIQDRGAFLHALHQQSEPHARIVFIDLKQSQRLCAQDVEQEVMAAGFLIEELDMTGCPDHYILSFRKFTQSAPLMS